MKLLDLEAFRLPWACRSPHGERGLKCPNSKMANEWKASLPARGAWVEIALDTSPPSSSARRSPHGERGLKSTAPAVDDPPEGRSPHGERGLK